MRLQLWKDFNQCWLSLLQKQKDLSSVATGMLIHQHASTQSLLHLDFLNLMGNELLHMCDQIENDGLVDYEMGFWEEEIMTSKFSITMNGPNKTKKECGSQS